MKQKIRSLSVLAGAVLLVASAHAAPTYGNLNTAAFTASLVPNYNDAVYMGTLGVIQNGDWRIFTQNNVEVALRARNRATFGLVDGSSGTYTFDSGLCNPVCTGSNKALWNYDFSVNVRADGTGTDDLMGKTVQIRVDTDDTAGLAFTAWTNVTTNWGDNAYWDGIDATDGDPERRVGTGPAQAGEFGLQQSVNPLFPNSLFQPGFNPFIAGLYRIEMQVINASGAVLSGTSMDVRVLPEPTSLALAAFALAGLGVASRRKA